MDSGASSSVRYSPSEIWSQLLSFASNSCAVGPPAATRVGVLVAIVAAALAAIGVGAAPAPGAGRAAATAINAATRTAAGFMLASSRIDRKADLLSTLTLEPR